MKKTEYDRNIADLYEEIEMTKDYAGNESAKVLLEWVLSRIDVRFPDLRKNESCDYTEEA